MDPMDPMAIYSAPPSMEYSQAGMNLSSGPSWISHFMGFSSLFGLGALFTTHSYIWDSFRLLVLGSIIETGRRLCQWLMERVRFQYSITARFDQGDPAYEWIVLFLTQEKVWKRSRDFRVTAKSSKREWSIETGPESVQGNAEYVPEYANPQLFRWEGYWLEIKRTNGPFAGNRTAGGPPSGGTIYVTVYTMEMSILSRLVEEARRQYINVSKPNVIVHSTEAVVMGHNYGRGGMWADVKRKPKRPLESIILREGVLQSLIQDAREFIDSEQWYNKAGIPHRMGILLYGPPGTGKSSTIYALAGELGFEIYSLSLASNYVDDSFLQRAASAVPKHSIFLIEDIDCAFPSREDREEDLLHNQYIAYDPYSQPPHRRRSLVTLSGLLNVIDGVGSEEGKLFFATTNYIDRLDAALLRPGRIDRKVPYSLATREQAEALYTRFFPESRLPDLGIMVEKGDSIEQYARNFADQIPSDEFSTAELQGYLLAHKKEPRQAVDDVNSWIERERQERREKREREAKRLEKMREQVKKRSNMYSPMPVVPTMAPVIESDF
ncbi:P-loop containing nucleoside triphosphate hydrolase protein [Desarmillaria tabescens]|uniref:P-loop containing nucleoside triphosphate hydrolase protein n=1 Tax=Armillaria tabescens TaxID=1929756 RepID=A0AA39MYX6_ARMTA|nr:P-loop containing nucleoside triphosphate hydrolase protein [Desarmillaria tabescens]KAK0451219.1 P-loop containing nucleoside triphosphate hydrolase protein [Desarmillaria tabescens]